jgi:hypothetical protein
MRYVALEKENDQQDDHDQQKNATTDVHLQPPWSQVPRVVTHSARLKNGRWSNPTRPNHFRRHSEGVENPKTTEEA